MLVGSAVVKKRIQVGSTSLPIEPQLEHIGNRPVTRSFCDPCARTRTRHDAGFGVIPVSTFSFTLTFALTLGEHVAEYQSRSHHQCRTSSVANITSAFPLCSRSTQCFLALEWGFRLVDYESG